jgi:enamine deaminase RidA (YjgF/YER057c/UK114 family)
MSNPTQRLKELGLELPQVATPVGAYVPALVHNDLLLLSGQIPLKDGAVAFEGKIGTMEQIEFAQQAARLCTLNGLAIAAQTLGSLDKIERVVRLAVYVASNPGFTQQHVVANGASELLADIFGDAGKHVRAAVGVAELPLNSAVEIELTFAVRA